MRAHSIAICGSGIGGLATAIALNARGHDVTLFETVANPQPIGSGLVLQPTGQSALARLGLLDQILDHGRRLSGIAGHTRSGKTIFNMNYDAIGADMFGIGIHRGALFHVLAAAAQQHGIPITCGVTVASSQSAGSKRLLVDATGCALGAFDLIVDATGLHSPLRRASAQVTINRQCAYGAVWGVTQLNADWQNPHTLSQVYDAAHTMIGILPIGRRPGTNQQLAAFFWSLKTADLAAWRATPFADWQARVAEIWPAAEPFVCQFHSHADLTPATYADIALKSAISDRLVFIGDAARSASPQLGQGANLALIDAVILTDCLGEHAGIAPALAAFDKARRAHTRFYGFASRWITPFFQSDSRLAAVLRDQSFATMARIPLVRREMVRTLAGLKTGVFSHQTPNGLVGAMPLKPVNHPTLPVR